MPPISNPGDSTMPVDPSSPDADQKTKPSEPNMVGSMVGGRYLIEKEIGRGGVGAVYLARDKPELMSRRVVVKVLLEDSLKNEWIVQKFHQEIESLTRLDDPGVVGVFDAGKLNDGSPYLVMQYVDGESLRSEIKQGGMELIRVANIMRQIGRTLQVAHAEGVIHRDLKPENIMLRRVTSADEQVKVIDFGIAKVKNSVVAPSTVTGVGVAGTIGYMSSEQLQAQTITPAADVYALGAIAYEMLTGNRPFNPETGFQLLEMQREGVRVLPKDLRPAISDRAQKVILKALEFDPKQRYQNAAVFGDALASALTGDVNPLDFSTAEIDLKSGGLLKHKVGVSEGVYTDAIGRHESSENSKSRKETNRRFPFVGVAIALLIIVAAGALVLWAPWRQKDVVPTTLRTFTYSLTVQKTVKDPKTNEYQPLGDPFASTGQEIYGNGWAFQLNMTPEQAGSLYLLNEGPGAGDAIVYNVLFPTPANNNNIAQLAAWQTIKTRQYFFNEYKGAEKMWIIWSAQPLAELDNIFKDASKSRLVISNPGQIKTVRDLLAKYDSFKPDVQSDKSRKFTTVKGTSDVLVSLLELQHEQY